MKRIVVVFAAMLLFVLLACSFKIKTNELKNYKSNDKLVESNSKLDIKMENRETNDKNKEVYYKNKAVVLTYHHISSKQYGAIIIKPERFESDIRMLREKGFNIISLREMVNAMDANGIMPDNAVVITFDDGIESFYKYAYPLLQKYKIPATNFIITSRNEAYKPSAKDINPLSPAEISEMYSSGLVDIQSHTNDSHEYVYINPELKKGPKLVHRIYNKDTKTLESEEDYTKRVIADLTKSREVIYKYTGHYPDMLCFPFGIYNSNVMDLAKKSGFNYFVTTQEGCNKQDSRRNKIFRIRTGDAKLDTEKIFNKILEITNSKKAH